jgi:hypothetical protein
VPDFVGGGFAWEYLLSHIRETKTSVLLVQKWNVDDPEGWGTVSETADYSIFFFATMQKSGKDNSGEKFILRSQMDRVNCCLMNMIT